jgi:hypothetical protein
MATAKKKIVSSTGGLKTDAVPDSPVFREERRPDPVPSGNTVGGIPVETLAQGHLIPFANTDQGIAEREARPHASASVTRDPYEKKVQRFGDSRLAMEPWEDANPMQEIIDAHLPAGHRPKFLSERVVRRQGRRGWTPIVVDGQPVKLGDMIFASMPEEKAVQRNKAYQSKGQEQVAEIHQDFKEKQEREFRDAGMRPEALRDRRDDLDSGLHSTRGEFPE